MATVIKTYFCKKLTFCIFFFCSEDVVSPYHISYLYYSAIAVIIVIVVGLLVSLITGKIH